MSGLESKRPELWAGPEYTHNRVQDEYFDQMERSGHAARISDLDLIASTGVRKVRYPVLWERVAPAGLDEADWSWTDERLHRLRVLGMDPIAGLVHHGSGPRHTSLLDPEFPQKLAEYAGAVAERYPWVEIYTPVNEPLTTSRFTGLYGHWYPHERDHFSWLISLSNQVKGIVLAMRAIKKVNPAAKLLATDDLGKTHSTEKLAYQAELENERRWLSFDLLLGKVTPEHPLWDYLRSSLRGEAELRWHMENTVPIDFLGLNHYLSSERYLDERLEYFPEHYHGGNGLDAYADVEAARVLPLRRFGPLLLLREAWDRYGLPMAISEVHNGCTREEQLRWILDMWNAAIQVNQETDAEDAPIRAICSWAFFGSYDWNRLCVSKGTHYEPGAFDVRAPSPRPTAIATLLMQLARGEELDATFLTSPGWWQRPDRLIYGYAELD